MLVGGEVVNWTEFQSEFRVIFTVTVTEIVAPGDTVTLDPPFSVTEMIVKGGAALACPANIRQPRTRLASQIKATETACKGQKACSVLFISAFLVTGIPVRHGWLSAPLRLKYCWEDHTDCLGSITFLQVIPTANPERIFHAGQRANT